MHRLIRPAAVTFAAFIALTVYAANVGADHPGITLVRWLPYGDKIGHLTLWGVLTLLINLAIPGRSVPIARFAVPIGTVVLSGVVLAEEMSQGWLDNRTLDPVDLLANLVGIGLATMGSRYLLSRRLISHQKPAGAAENPTKSADSGAQNER